uniref:PDZ domain-containing protein n=1 Tax=Chrysotila carterae TaxID=13221 RepID=A0A7S4B2J5_CHRCT|mmetsp:Transcript_46717/g.101500  ORF Transcript_46717/g.101500 Transcript_46717/m.101500 type:complete len:137 (-) Transcript_46717:426-836(-)
MPGRGKDASRQERITLLMVKPEALSALGVGLHAKTGKRSATFCDVMLGATFLDRKKHVLVERVDVGYPAAAAGLQIGDEIISINNEMVSSVCHAEGILQMAGAGTLQLDILRTAAGSSTLSSASGGQPPPVVGVPL